MVLDAGQKKSFKVTVYRRGNKLQELWFAKGLVGKDGKVKGL